MADTPVQDTDIGKGIDDGLERDLRIALGLDDETQTTPQDNQTSSLEDQQPSGSPGPQAGETKPSEPPSPPTPEWEIDGEKITPDQVREWRKGYLRMDDYTRKTQRLSERERELEQLRQRLAPLIQVEQILAANPHLYQTLQQTLQRAVTGQAPMMGASPMAQRGLPQGQVATQPSPGFGPMTGFGIDPVLEQRLSNLERIEAEQQLDRTLQEVRNRANAERQEFGLPPLSDAEWQQVSTQLMNEALQAKINDLHLVYRQSTFRDQWYREAIQKAREAALQEQRERQRQQAGVVMNGSPRGSIPAPSVSEPPKTLEEATRRAAAELRSSGLRLYDPD